MRCGTVWLLTAMVLTGCSAVGTGFTEAQPVQTITIRQEPRGAEELEDYAAEMVERVWNVDVAGWNRETTIDNLEVRFFSGQNDSYFIVGWREDDIVPCWMYRMGMDSDPSGTPIDPESAETQARELLTETLGIVLGTEKTEWYTYDKRTAVLLRDIEGIRYHVLYRQEDSALCGYQIFDDEQTMHRFYEAHGAERVEKIESHPSGHTSFE